jgi:hypothetical protein
MSISAVNQPISLEAQQSSAQIQGQAAVPQAPRAPDGDSPAVEALESAAAKAAEKQNGGFRPNPGSAGLVNKVA